MRIRSLAAALALQLLLASAAAADEVRKVAFFGFDLINTSMEPTSAAETARIAMLNELFREKLTASGKYDIVEIPAAALRELADGPFVRRYNTQETDDGLDFQDEGAFKLLSFWLVGNLICTGRIEQATRYFEQLLGCANHVGLFAEMIDPRTGEFLGNFPQAYSHIGLIHTARNLSRALTGQPVKTEHLLPQMAFAD